MKNNAMHAEDQPNSLRLWQRLLQRWMHRKISVRRIEVYCSQPEVSNTDSRSAFVNRFQPHQLPRKVRVSCVQRTIRPVAGIEEYIQRLQSYVEEAVMRGSDLVVFPEYNFLDLFGLIPGFTLINRRFTRSGLSKLRREPCGSEQETDRPGPGLSPGPLFVAVAAPIEAGIEAIVAHLAKRYGVSIYTGSYVTRENNLLYNTGSLYGPDGKRIGRQKKLHLTDLEEAFGMARGDRLEVVHSPIGKIVFPICMDATYFETFRLADQLGAEMVIIPIANPEEYNQWKALKGIWPRVQESYTFGLKASLTGWFAGMHYTGRAGIFAPLGLTPGGDGVLALSTCAEGDELVTAVLDLEGLRCERESAEYFGDSNPEFEREYVERCYFSKREGLR